MKNKADLLKKRQELIYFEYIKLINSDENILVGIEIVLEKLKMSLSKFLKILMEYIKENIPDNEYTIIFDTLLETDKPEEYLKNNLIPPELLKDNLNNYLLYKRPDILFGNKKLLRTLERLVKYNELLWQNAKTKEKFKEETLPKIKDIINEFINLPYSLERFTMVKKISKQLFYSNKGFYTKQLALYDNNLYQKFLENLKLKEEIKNETISNDVQKILNLINLKNNNFDSIDFYKATIYSPIEIMEVADKILDANDQKNFHIYVNRYRSHHHTKIATECNIKKELISNKLSITIDGILYETKEEDRIAIINFLEEEFIPINSITFLDACIRFYKNDTKTKEMQ